MGDWCASGNEGDTETNEDPGAKQEPHGSARKKRRGLEKGETQAEEMCAHLTTPTNG